MPNLREENIRNCFVFQSSQKVVQRSNEAGLESCIVPEGVIGRQNQMHH